MPFPITIKVLENKPPSVTVREWRKITDGTYEAIGAYWYAHMLPQHFKANAANVYGYRPRRRKYDEAKRGRRRGFSPMAASMSLTKSGLLHMAMTQLRRVIKAYPTRFTVRMPGLPYTPSRQRTSTQPFLQGELTKLLKREITVLKRIGKAEALRLINQTKERKETLLK